MWEILRYAQNTNNACVLVETQGWRDVHYEKIRKIRFWVGKYKARDHLEDNIKVDRSETTLHGMHEALCGGLWEDVTGIL